MLLVGFPSVIVGAIWLTLFLLRDGQWDYLAQKAFTQIFPIAIICIGLWFLIAFKFHTKMIQYAVKSKELERKENMRVYNLVENLKILIS